MFDEEREERPRIKVTDRRLFDADGNLRDTEEAAEATVAETPEPASPPEPEGTSAAASAAEPAAPHADTATAAEPLEADDETLMPYVQEQYYMAMMALGAMPDPQTGEPKEDLPMAKLRIDMMGSLHERVDTRVAPEAKQALDQILYQLRMAYLQKSKVVKL